MLTIHEAAAALGISPWGVRKLIQRGQLRATRFGSAHAIADEEIERAKSRPAPGRPRQRRKSRP